MSDNYMRLIPTNPKFIPTEEAQFKAKEFFRKIAPKADGIKSLVHQGIQFVDSDNNWEGVRCSNCNEELDDWWQGVMSQKYKEGRFDNLSIVTPCCKKEFELNELNYVWPVGFATYTLEATNASIGGRLNDEHVTILEKILGCEVQLILAHY